MATTFAVPDGRVAMAATTYTGTGATLAVSNAVNTVGMQPDLVWIKNRTAANSHQLADSVRGVTKYLFSDATSAEETRTDQVTAFSASGFSLSALVVNTAVNNTGNNYVGWQWKAGGTAGFAIVTYTGTGANATVGHGLGTTPQFIIVKGRTNAVNWPCYHISLTSASYVIFLNGTNGQGANPQVFQGVTPTASVFSVGGDAASSASTINYVAYCWAPVAGYSAFGSYTGNGSADGPFIYTGFRPRWIMTKSSSGVENWYVYDTARDTYNYASLGLLPNLSNAETSYGQIDILSNGFKMRGVGSSWNASGATYIYAAFAENPLKYANAR